MYLKNKNILFFSSNFFGYENEIKHSIERQGGSVDYYNERPSSSVIVKALIRINRNILSRYIDRYYTNIIANSKNKKYDYIFFIKGESVSSKQISKLRSAHPEAKIIIYHWDSIENNKNAIRTTPLFDKVFSFDKPDCEKFGMTFLPLFYLPEYSEVGKSTPEKYEYDLLFIGTAHSDRYTLIKKISDEFVNNGLLPFIYMYFPSRLLYYKQRFINRSLGKSRITDFNFKALSKSHVLDLYKRSKIIIDIQHPKQTGLTMRCLEVVGAKRKLITTNRMISEYDFFDSNNILIIDRTDPVIPHDFTSSVYEDIPLSIYDKYNIDNWIRTIIN